MDTVVHQHASVLRGAFPAFRKTMMIKVKQGLRPLARALHAVKGLRGRLVILVGTFAREPRFPEAFKKQWADTLGWP